MGNKTHIPDKPQPDKAGGYPRRSGRSGNRGAAVVGNAEINCSNLEGL